MTQDHIIQHFSVLGRIFGELAAGRSWGGFELGISEVEYADMQTLLLEAEKLNPWFAQDQIAHALASWSAELTPDKLRAWAANYAFAAEPSKKVGVIMAGNIPLVGLHDFVSILISGHSIIIRPSSDDHILIRMVAAVLEKIDAGLKERILWADGKMKGFDAVIATGSNNTARYFEHYFGKVPHIIRKNRNAVAILDGSETPEEIALLGEDIFRYFGMGCRSVSKLYVPEDFVLDRFFEGIYGHHNIVQHNKYANNYDYYRAVFLLNADDILDNNFLLLKKHEALASPVATLHYERYSDRTALEQELVDRATEVQCIVGKGHIPFGGSQQPSLSDYADGVDTMRFLEELS